MTIPLGEVYGRLHPKLLAQQCSRTINRVKRPRYISTGNDGEWNKPKPTTGLLGVSFSWL